MLQKCVKPFFKAVVFKNHFTYSPAIIFYKIRRSVRTGFWPLLSFSEALGCVGPCLPVLQAILPSPSCLLLFIPLFLPPIYHIPLAVTHLGIFVAQADLFSPTSGHHCKTERQQLIFYTQHLASSPRLRILLFYTHPKALNKCLLIVQLDCIMTDFENFHTLCCYQHYISWLLRHTFFHILTF